MIGINSVNADDVRRVIKVLKQVDADIVKDLRAELRGKLGPVANQIASAVPNEPPLSGFANNGATGWGPVRGKTAFTPGKSRRNANSLVSIRIDSGTKRGPYIAELAGTRTSGRSPQGEAMIYQLQNRKATQGRGGRYAYAQFRLLRPDVVRLAEDILNKTFKELENLMVK